MEETISRMAGSTNGSRKDVTELEAMAILAGRPSRQRTTTYGPVDEGVSVSDPAELSPHAGADL